MVEQNDRPQQGRVAEGCESTGRGPAVENRSKAITTLEHQADVAYTLIVGVDQALGVLRTRWNAKARVFGYNGSASGKRKGSAGDDSSRKRRCSSTPDRRQSASTGSGGLSPPEDLYMSPNLPYVDQAHLMLDTGYSRLASPG